MPRGLFPLVVLTTINGRHPSASRHGYKRTPTTLPHGKFCIRSSTSPDTPLRKSPKIKVKLRAPIELENLLPYNLQYRIYDKNADQNWKSYLRKGGVMPVHSVELDHLVLLNVEVQDTGELYRVPRVGTNGSCSLQAKRLCYHKYRPPH